MINDKDRTEAFEQAVRLLGGTKNAMKSVEWQAAQVQISKRQEDGSPKHRDIQDKLTDIAGAARTLHRKLSTIDLFTDTYLFYGQDTVVNSLEVGSERANLLIEAGLLDFDKSLDSLLPGHAGPDAEHKILRQLSALAEIAESAEKAVPRIAGGKGNAQTKTLGSLKFQLALHAIPEYEIFKPGTFEGRKTAPAPFCDFIGYVYMYAFGEEWATPSNVANDAVKAHIRLCKIQEQIKAINAEMGGMGQKGRRKLEEMRQSLYAEQDDLVRGRGRYK